MNLRRVAALLSGDPTYGTLLRSAMNKAVYWAALQSMLLATVIPLLSHKVGPPKDADHVFSTETLTRDALVVGTRFFWCRYAFGIAVLQRDIIEKAWQTIDLPLDLDFVRSDRHRIGAMLRRSSGMTITFHDAAKAHASVRSALSAVQASSQGQRCCADCASFLHYAQSWFGVGCGCRWCTRFFVVPENSLVRLERVCGQVSL